MFTGGQRAGVQVVREGLRCLDAQELAVEPVLDAGEGDAGGRERLQRGQRLELAAGGNAANA